MSDKIEREALSKYGRRCELKRTLLREGHGATPVLRRKERNAHLGQLLERVAWVLTLPQLETNVVSADFGALLDPRQIEKLLVRADHLSRAMAYVQAAVKRGVQFSVVSSPDFTGDVVLVLLRHA
ncbi:MAG: DUF1694 domain-containing protein [Thermaerobacter sp.]|nr:DUF1694 domain-containing protein [Thermaerobacter sp.]